MLKRMRYEEDFYSDEWIPVILPHDTDAPRKLDRCPPAKLPGLDSLAGRDR